MPRIEEVINNLLELVPYQGTNATLIQRQCALKAFLHLSLRLPKEIEEYLLIPGNQHYGLQHKLFQEFAHLLSDRIPFSFKRNGKMSLVKSLFDDNLNVFAGISIFDAIIDENKSIKNETKEYYVGGRKGTYYKPFFLGKILDIIDIEKSRSILLDMKEYSFQRIQMIKSIPKTLVRVSHLRITPHYQMGGMVYINRARKQILKELSIV